MVPIAVRPDCLRIPLPVRTRTKEMMSPLLCSSEKTTRAHGSLSYSGRRLITALVSETRNRAVFSWAAGLMYGWQSRSIQTFFRWTNVQAFMCAPIQVSAFVYVS